MLQRSHEQRRGVLVGVADRLPVWKAKILKEKAIYHTMNMFNYDIGRKCLIAEGWCPITSSDDIQLALRRASVYPIPLSIQFLVVNISHSNGLMHWFHPF